MNLVEEKPLVTDYSHFRSYLKDFVAYQRQTDPKFSLAFYSRRIKLSDAYLKLVVQGRRNIDLDKAYDLAGALSLSPSERAYFIFLVQENQAKNMGLKRFLRAQMNEVAQGSLSYSSNKSLVTIFEDSLTWEVFSLIGIDGFRHDPNWIAKKLKNKAATVQNVSRVLERLLKIGVVKIGEDGALQAQDIVIPRKFNPSRAYATALARAQTHIAQGLSESSYFDSLCVITNQEELAEIKSLLEETKRRISKIAIGQKSRKTHIAYLNMNLFLASE